jgi:hypothetical protein
VASVNDCIEKMAAAGQISRALADEAASIYRQMIDQGVAEDVAALALAEALRVAATAQLRSVAFCLANPDRIDEVKTAMREQWREAQAGRVAH